MKHFKQMDISTEKKYRLINYNFKLILFVIAAMIMGSITICSVRPDFLTKQLIGVSACIIGMIVVSLIDYDFICKYYMVLYVINIGLYGFFILIHTVYDILCAFFNLLYHCLNFFSLV